MQNAAAVRQQQFACFGGVGATSIADEQVLPQLDLQQAYLSAQCRLCNVERNGGAGKTAQFRHTYKVFKLFQVHH